MNAAQMNAAQLNAAGNQAEIPGPQGPGDDRPERLATVLAELADLGRMLGRRAADLARLAEASARAPFPGHHPTGVPAAAELASAAAEIAADAAAMTAAEASRPSDRSPQEPTGTPRTIDRTGRRPGDHRSRDHRLREDRPRDDRSRDKRRRSTAATNPQPPGEPAASPTPRTTIPAGRRRIAPGPLVASSIVHALALIVLAVIFVPGAAKRPPITLEFGIASADTASAEDAVLLVAPESPSSETEDAAASTTDMISATLPAPLDVPLAEPPGAAALADPLADPVADVLAAMPPPGDAVGGEKEGLPDHTLLAEIAATGKHSAAAGGRPAETASTATTFFGRSGAGRSVCFLCDNSNSHRDGGFHVVLEEVARAIDGLRPDQSFFVIFFSDAAYPLFHPAPGAASATGLVPATPDNKRKLRAWLETVEMCRGGQGIHDAVKLAGSLEPDLVYLLSDGQMAGSVVDQVREADFGGAVVHTLGMQQWIADRRTGRLDPDRLREQEGCNRKLITIAAAHGGGFTPVFVPPFAAGFERARPIARNRSRGPVWGLRL